MKDSFYSRLFDKMFDSRCRYFHSLLSDHHRPLWLRYHRAYDLKLFNLEYNRANTFWLH